MAETTTSTGGLAGVAQTFGVRGDLLAAQLVNFLIVMLVLWRFAYRPVIKMLDERERKISESVKNANEISQKLRALEDEKMRILTDARAVAETNAKETVEATKKRCDDMLAVAKTQVEDIVAKGKKTLEADRASMLIALRSDIVNIAMSAAERILSESMTEKKSQSLAEEVVRKMT